MGPERLWLLGVTVAAAVLCLLRTSQSAESVVQARVGGVTELGCSLTPPSEGATTPNLFPLHVVEWVRLGYNVPVLIKFGVYAPRVHPKYKGRVSLTRGASLLVEDLTLEDEGWFECRILLLDRTTDDFRNGTWIFLSISAPPVFIKTPPNFVEVLLGAPLTLSCSAHGNPQPAVSWRKDDNLVEEHEQIQVLNGTLSLAKVTRETSGMYRCHVSNSEGNLTHTTQLLVKGPPVIIIPPEDTVMNMSQDAVLQCQAKAYPSNLTYEWWKQGVNVFHLESLKSRVKILVDGTLLIPALIPEDSGNYTCIPTNGLLTPPSASAFLKVKHPARVVRMPRHTYLPAGMGGVIVCPVQAEPPMLFVNWTKDGGLLNLDQYPGWMVNSEGSVFIAAANDDAVGMYACTAYNSYGTMGQSEPTQVILQDPPAFIVTPRAEYLQEVGRELAIPCQAHGDPAPNITWIKMGSSPRSPYTVSSNGSLLLQPLGKDHQGDWECRASNRVATISTGTLVLVLGTSPHAVSSMSVVPGMNQANVSWEPGFDGGYTQKFTVWVKPTARGKHEWASLPVPTSKSHLLVTGLLAGTSYQFSVLPQNKLGSGPFSEIITVMTLAPPTDAPTQPPTIIALAPPTSLSANRTMEGILLQWIRPQVDMPITGFILQARRAQGEWETLNASISTNTSEMIVQGLVKDSNYDLRMMSRRDQMVGEPSESVNITTSGMDMYPVRSNLMPIVTEPLLAGVIGGVCFLFVAIILSLVTACVMNHRREKRRRKKRDDIPSAFEKSSSPQACSPTDSPDSVLKLKLCPPLSFFPSSSCSQSDRSSFDKGSRSEYQDQRKQLLSSSSPPPRYALFESHLGGSPSPTPAIESISRGPDGRFIVQPYPGSSTPSHIKKNLKKEFPQSPVTGSGRGSSKSGSFRESPKSSSLTDKEEKKESPLTVDVPNIEKLTQSPGRVKTMARNFSRHGCFHSDDGQGASEALLERVSFYSDSCEKHPRDSLKKYRVPGHPEDIFPSLSRKRERLHHTAYQPMENESQLTNSSTLVSHLDSHVEQDSLSHCLRLAKEREEMEMELESYTASRRGQFKPSDERRPKSASPQRNWANPEIEEPVWKLQNFTLRQKSQRPSSVAHRVSDYRRGCYFGNTSSPMDVLSPSSPSYIQWDISPVSSPTNLVPLQSLSVENPPGVLHSSSPQRRVSVEDSAAAEYSCSPATQCTSLSIISHASGNVSHNSVNLSRARSMLPGRATEQQQMEEFLREPPVEEYWEEEREEQGGALSHACSPSLAGSVSERVFQIKPEQERTTSPVPSLLSNPTQTSSTRERGQEEGGKRPIRSPSGCSTLPYEHQRTGAKMRTQPNDRKSVSQNTSSLLFSDQDKEGIRARSRKSDKCLLSDSTTCASPLPLENEGEESNQSSFSGARISESIRAKLAPQPSRMSPLQTSAILEYLSLPGFIEMSVDEPTEEAESSEMACPSSEHEAGTLLRTEPDVLPRHWEACTQEGSPPVVDQHSGALLDCKTTCVSVEHHKSAADVSGSRHLQSDSGHKLGTLDINVKPRSQNVRLTDASTECARPLNFQRTSAPNVQPHLVDINLSQTLVCAAKNIASVASRSPNQCEDIQPTSEQSQRLFAQGNGTNKIVSRIHQVPFLKKSITVGPCRTLSAIGQPRPFLKKSISLGSQKWDHYRNPKTFVPERCSQEEFPCPDVRTKSYSLGRAPTTSFSVPGSGWQGPGLHPPPGCRISERAHHPERTYTRPSYLIPDPQIIHQSWHSADVSLQRHLPDPRRQATIFPDSIKCPISYQETLRSVQHKYVPLNSSHPLCPPRPGVRLQHPCPLDYRRGPQRGYLPRGYSWPSPYHPSPYLPREFDIQREAERGLRMSGRPETEIRESGRASYASQSSGRGSVGPYGHGHLRQSLSITPTLLSSPETTEESERHRMEMDHLEKRGKRRNTSVDESYEWDATDQPVDPEILEAMKLEQPRAGIGRGREIQRDRPSSTTGLRELQYKGSEKGSKTGFE
ncbi:protein turtle homolog A isoform X2 [Denticeps clupeoides]|uniref:Uncharacterized protein n=1 Tax=Denticeps clupeoides TaxID=299321 RepID=A0AAY4EQV4_9TELE|nr:protein turtle homolog A-like isoform X2 [Denticeps clupeoides]